MPTHIEVKSTGIALNQLISEFSMLIMIKMFHCENSLNNSYSLSTKALANIT